jgi:hypothetical protein
MSNKEFRSIEEWTDYYFPHGLPAIPPVMALSPEAKAEEMNLRQILMSFAETAKVFSADGLPHTKAYARTVQQLQQHFGRPGTDDDTARALLQRAADELYNHAMEYSHPGQHGLIRQIKDYLEQ